jgi:hypothetical protein
VDNLARGSLVAESNVERIIQKRLIVRTHVDSNRQSLPHL